MANKVDMYETLKNAFNNKIYTVNEAIGILNSLLLNKSLKAKEYNELYALAIDTLSPNTPEDEEDMAWNDVLDRITGLETAVSAIEKKLEEIGETVETPAEETHAGTIDDPIPAKPGIEYQKKLYYIENGVKYLCTKKMKFNGMPSDYVNVYFEVVEEPEEGEATATEQPESSATDDAKGE